MKWDFLLRWRWEAALTACIAVALGILTMSETGNNRLANGYNDALESMLVTSRLSEMMVLLVDAETGQRGYLLTRREGYLTPLDASLPKLRAVQDELRAIYVLREPAMINEYGALIGLIGGKLTEIEQTVELSRAGKTSAALELVASDLGERKMDEIRAAVERLQTYERDRTAMLVNDWRGSLQLSRLAIAGTTTLSIVLLVLIMRWLKRDWLRSRQHAELLDGMVRQRTAELATLSAHLQVAGESEKSRLARELHDELGSILTASKMDVAWARGKLPAELTAPREKLERAMKNLDAGIQIGRRIIEDLRPTTLASFGLTTAARELAQQAAEQAEWHLELDLPDHDPELPEDVEIALFRILQESVNNAAKYAQATRMRVALRCEKNDCQLEIQDNGIGFRRADVRPKSHGLLGMQQRLHARGGRLDIESAPGRGTLVRAYVSSVADLPADPFSTPRGATVAAPVEDPAVPSGAR